MNRSLCDCYITTIFRCVGQVFTLDLVFFFFKSCLTVVRAQTTVETKRINSLFHSLNNVETVEAKHLHVCWIDNLWAILLAGMPTPGADRVACRNICTNHVGSCQLLRMKGRSTVERRLVNQKELWREDKCALLKGGLEKWAPRHLKVTDTELSFWLPPSFCIQGKRETQSFPSSRCLPYHEFIHVSCISIITGGHSSVSSTGCPWGILFGLISQNADIPEVFG